MKKVIFLLSFLFLGVVLRFFLLQHAFKPLVFDSSEYVRIAHEFIEGKFPIDCCFKTEGYSLFIATILSIFGKNNIDAVRVVQIFLDIVTGVILYLVSKKVFNKQAAVITFVLYMLHPLAASYTGLILSETFTLFLISCLLLLISSSRFLTHKFLWIIFGALLGFLVFTKLSFYYLVLTYLVFFTFFVIEKKKKIFFFAISLVGFLLISSYTMIRYYQEYKIVTIVPVRTMQAGILYSNFFSMRYPEVEFTGISPEFTQMAEEYRVTPFEKRDEFSKKYKTLLLNRLRYDWGQYGINLGKNAVWLWDHNHLFLFKDDFYPADMWFVRVSNITLFLFGFIGFFLFIKKDKKRLVTHPVVLLTLLTFLYMTFGFSLVSSESRHTLSFYPILFLWVGYCAGKLTGRTTSRTA